MPNEISPAQARWIGSLSPEQRRRFDALRPPGWSFAQVVDRWQRNYRDFPRALAFLLDVAEAGATDDPIIAAEIERILGPIAEPPPEPPAYPALLG